MRIGIAGLGKMGAAIAGRLQETGADVAGWARVPGKVSELGFHEAATPHDLAMQCDIVISSLFDAQAIDAVYAGADGLLAAANGKLFIDMSTLRPQEQVALAAQVRHAGGAFVECPVGGTTGPARAGQLLGLAGGDPVDVARAMPVLQRLCRRVEHLGPVGAGATAKLAINLPLLAFWQALGEAMLMLEPLGQSPEWLVALLGDTAGAPAVLKLKAASITAAFTAPEAVESTFAIDTMRKDLCLILEEAESQGHPVPVAATVLEAFDKASNAGWGGHDCSCIPAFWREAVK